MILSNAYSKCVHSEHRNAQISQKQTKESLFTWFSKLASAHGFSFYQELRLLHVNEMFTFKCILLVFYQQNRCHPHPITGLSAVGVFYELKSNMRFKMSQAYW